jgi:hypothetical protein
LKEGIISVKTTALNLHDDRQDVTLQASAGSLMQIDTDAAKWIGLAEAWLTKRFSLALPEKPDCMATMVADSTK